MNHLFVMGTAPVNLFAVFLFWFRMPFGYVFFISSLL